MSQKIAESVDAISQIRNFCIIAHIDHGKSTLADRLLEVTGTVEKRDMKEQLLDTMDLERERGITIKLQPVRMNYEMGGSNYQLNLIDTPGHVDFSYEVSRSLQACEGAILVVDASQGIQAQTLANVYLAMEQDLKIIPVLNKVDLPAAEPEKRTEEVVKLLGCEPEEVLQVSAKTGQGVEDMLQKVIQFVPPPKGHGNQPTRALIFDSHYDEFRGVILYTRVVDGQIDKGDELVFMANDTETDALDIGVQIPGFQACKTLQTGEVGSIVTSLKSSSLAKVGDTLTLKKAPANQALPGYKEINPFVYAGIFPSSNDQYPQLKDAMERLQLSDAALTMEAENSTVMGYGYRVGFLGMLHLEIIKERLEREFDLSVIITTPSTDYQITTIKGEELNIKNASLVPDQNLIKEIREPWVVGELVTPKQYVGDVLGLLSGARGSHKNINYDGDLTIISFEAPLANIVTNFFDNLKSATSGYGSFSYDLKDYRAEELVRLDYLVANEKVEALSIILHKSEAEKVARQTLEKLKEVIPKQLFKVSLQGAIGGRFIAREDIPALKKNVTGHLYGGDVSRKKKLWAKQKRGKERMKKFGKVDIPTDAFTAILKQD